MTFSINIWHIAIMSNTAPHTKRRVSGINTQIWPDIRGYEFRILRKMLGHSNRRQKNMPDSNRIFQEYIESSGSKNFRLLPHTRRWSILTNSDPNFWLLAQLAHNKGGEFFPNEDKHVKRVVCQRTNLCQCSTYTRNMMQCWNNCQPFRFKWPYWRSKPRNHLQITMKQVTYLRLDGSLFRSVRTACSPVDIRRTVGSDVVSLAAVFSLVTQRSSPQFSRLPVISLSCPYCVSVDKSANQVICRCGFSLCHQTDAIYCSLSNK